MTATETVYVKFNVFSWLASHFEFLESKEDIIGIVKRRLNPIKFLVQFSVVVEIGFMLTDKWTLQI